MKTKQLREMQTDHLEHELADQQKHLFDLRTQAVTEKLENPSQLGKTRRQIARVKTLLWQRKLAEGKASATEGKASATEGKASATEGKASVTEGKASATEGKASATEGKVSAVAQEQKTK